MSKIIDLTMYDNRSVLQLLKGNSKVTRIQWDSGKWSDLEKCINSICKLTKEQLEYLKPRLEK